MKLFSALYNGLMNFENNFCCIPYIAKLGVGVQFPAKTSIIRRENELFVISPGPLEAEAELLNEYKLNFISPNNFHHFHLKAMQQRFPEAKFYGGMRAKKQCGVDLQPLKNLEGLDFLKIEGNDLLGERVFYHPESKHLITTDIVFNMHHKMNPRHLSEFWMIEPEVAFADLDEVADLGARYIQYMIQHALEHCADEIEFFNRFIEKGLKDKLENVLA